MSKQGLMDAATTAASIATFLAVDTGEQRVRSGWSAYNNQRMLTVTGDVQQISDHTPRTTIRLQSANTLWTAVLASPLRLRQRGLPQGALKVGQTVSVVGYRHHSKANELRVERLIIGDRTIELRR